MGTLDPVENLCHNHLHFHYCKARAAHQGGWAWAAKWSGEPSCQRSPQEAQRKPAMRGQPGIGICNIENKKTRITRSWDGMKSFVMEGINFLANFTSNPCKFKTSKGCIKKNGNFKWKGGGGVLRSIYIFFSKLGQSRPTRPSRIVGQGYSLTGALRASRLRRWARIGY